MQSDLFGRMLAVSLEAENNSPDVEKLLSYPLTPIPLCLCRLDGTICKTDKSALVKCLEVKSEDSLPPTTDIYIFDGFFLLHTIPNASETYSKYSQRVLSAITKNNASEIHVIFDQYITPSIKDYERSIRNDTSISRPHKITEDTSVPLNLIKELRNSMFKQALVNFFIKHWTSDEIIPIIGDKKIYLNYEQCFLFQKEGNIISKTEVFTLSCPDHEEADSKIIYHVCNIYRESSFLIRCSDTDILVILLGNFHKINEQSTVRILSGTGKNKKIINVNDLYNKLGVDLCKSLPAFHAFTGCDYNPSFYRKAKLGPFKILRKSAGYQAVFGNLPSKQPHNLQEDFTEIQKYVSEIYGFKRKNNDENMLNVNSARFACFLKSYRIKNLNDPFSKKSLKKFDAAIIPPSERELYQHFLRSFYIAKIWGNAEKKTLWRRMIY